MRVRVRRVAGWCGRSCRRRSRCCARARPRCPRPAARCVRIVSICFELVLNCFEFLSRGGHALQFQKYSLGHLFGPSLAHDRPPPASSNTAAGTVAQRCKSCESNEEGLGRGDKRMALERGCTTPTLMQRTCSPSVRATMVFEGGIWRASRNGRVSSSPTRNSSESAVSLNPLPCTTNRVPSRLTLVPHTSKASLTAQAVAPRAILFCRRRRRRERREEAREQRGCSHGGGEGDVACRGGCSVWTTTVVT